MSDEEAKPPGGVTRAELLVILATAWPAGLWFGVHLVARLTETAGAIQFVGALVVLCIVLFVGVLLAKVPRPAPLVRGVIGCALGIVLALVLPGFVDGLFR